MVQSCLWQAISSWPGMGLQDLQSSENLLAQHNIKGTMISTSMALVPKFTRELNIAFRLQPLTIAFFQGFLFHLKGIGRTTQMIYPSLPL